MSYPRLRESFSSIYTRILRIWSKLKVVNGWKGPLVNLSDGWNWFDASLEWFWICLRGIDALLGAAILSRLICLPSEKGSTLKGKTVPFRSKFFPFRVDPFADGDWCPGRQTGSHKSYLPSKHMAEHLPSARSPFKIHDAWIKLQRKANKWLKITCEKIIKW